QIPKNAKKPTPADIATLGLGQFIACWSTHTLRVYVQPEWMDGGIARSVAMGDGTAAVAAIKPIPEDTVNQREAARITADNERLAAENLELRERIESLEALQLQAVDAGANGKSKVDRLARTAAERRPIADDMPSERVTFSDGGLDEIYKYVAGRLTQEAPKLLQTVGRRPELEIAFEPEILRADGDSLRGRCGRLILDG